MPYIRIEGGTMSAEQKKELIERLTAVSSEIMRVPPQFFTVTINELSDDNIGIGGRPIGEIKKDYRP